MEQEQDIPPGFLAQVPPSRAFDRATRKSNLPHYSAKPRDTSEPSSHFHESRTSDKAPDDPVSLDIQYVSVTLKLKSLLKKSGEWPDLRDGKKSEVMSSLRITLIDLEVWAYDLSDKDASILEYLRSLSSHSHELKTALQQNFLAILNASCCRLRTTRKPMGRLSLSSCRSSCNLEFCSTDI